MFLGCDVSRIDGLTMKENGVEKVGHSAIVRLSVGAGAWIRAPVTEGFWLPHSLRSA